MRAKNANVFLYAILLALMMLCRTRPQASNFRIAFIKPKTGGLGFSFADFRGKIVVISIEKNSPVGNSGMVSVGNIILSIQGQDVAGMSAQGLASTIRAFPPGQRIIFTFKDILCHRSRGNKTRPSCQTGNFILQ